MRAVARPGRWVWGLSGLVTAAALAVPGARLIVSVTETLVYNPQVLITVQG